MIRGRWLIVGAVVGLTAASVAGVALGAVIVVTVERVRDLMGEVEWDAGDE